MKFRNFVSSSLLLVLVLCFGLSIAKAASAEKHAAWQGWFDAPRHSAGIAPDPAKLADTAIVQVYIAPTYGWRGLVAVHPWIIFKKPGETAYTRYDVIGWAGDEVVQRNYAIADGLWYGAQPKLLVDHRGAVAATMISEIEAAIASYPFAHTYRAYPGPNSNTFMAHIGREVPALKLDLPANAVGKDYRSIGNPIGLSSSGRGIQASLLGMGGISIGLEEGIEINFMGLNFGLDLNSPGLRLPFIGRIGMDDTTQETHP
ncbi:MAG: hypothetical protein H6R07_663 [Proteobacteria bacterium]|nr:hypothetical protein [Pseudomonadota bacterium]